MTSVEQEQRARVIEEALSWVRTPYHHLGRVKGIHGGVDCACFIADTFANSGVCDRLLIQDYPPDWHLHADADDPNSERLLNQVKQYANPVQEPQPGDIVLYKIARAFAHGAIVMPPGWPTIIHADRDARMVLKGIGNQGSYAIFPKSGKPREVMFYSPWAKSPEVLT